MTAATTTATVPGPSPTPVFGWRGNAFSFFRNPVAYMSTLRHTCGDVARLAATGNKALFIRPTVATGSTYFAFGPQCNREILTQPGLYETRAPRGPSTRPAERLATNILFLNGAQHKAHRRQMLAAFTRERLQAYHQHMVAYTERMLDAWEVGGVVDVSREISRVALQISSRCFYDLDARQREDDLASLMLDMIYGLFTPAAMIPIRLPGTPYYQLVRKIEQICSRLEREVEKKRQGPDDAPDVLTKLVKLHDEDRTLLSEDELIGDAFVLFFAGHDTSSKALTWTLFLLAQHPDVLAELVEELDDQLGGGPPAYDQLYALPVLDRVIKESLRLLPPAIAFPRYVCRDTVLGGYEIPAASEVIYSPYITHQDADIFSNPRRFNPDRWQEITPSSYEYLPFGAGARACIGGAFGSMMVRVVLPIIVQRYRLQLVPGTRIDIKTHVVMAPHPGMPMTVHPQDREFASNRSEISGFIREMVELT